MLNFIVNQIYDDSYIKTKVKTFSDMIKNLFDGNEIPKERIEHVCVACISVNSVLSWIKNGIHKVI